MVNANSVNANSVCAILADFARKIRVLARESSFSGSPEKPSKSYPDYA